MPPNKNNNNEKKKKSHSARVLVCVLSVNFIYTYLCKCSWEVETLHVCVNRSNTYQNVAQKQYKEVVLYTWIMSCVSLCKLNVQLLSQYVVSWTLIRYVHIQSGKSKLFTLQSTLAKTILKNNHSAIVLVCLLLVNFMYLWKCSWITACMCE